jgi:hypothetical protein
VQPANDTLITALAAGERVHATTTRLGGKDISGQVSTWAVDRAYSTDLPAPMRAANGSASAQLTATLTGDGTSTAAQLYSPYAPNATADMARPRQSAVHGWGVAGQTLPSFRGTVRSRSADSATGTVEVTALDGAERLRDVARLPACVSTYNDPIASGTWIVDHLARQAGIHSAPPPRSDCLMYASMHGGVVPSIGFYADHDSWGMTYKRTNAPWEMAAVAGSTPYNVVWIPRTRTVVPGDGLLAECWVDNTVIGELGGRVQLSLIFRADAAVNPVRFWVDFKTTQAGLGTDTSEKSWSSVPVFGRGRWHIGVRWGFNWLTPYATFYLSSAGTKVSFDAGTFPDLPASWTQLDRVELNSALPTEAVQVSRRDGDVYAEFNNDGYWQRGAVLDEVTSLLHAIPPTQGSAWDVVTAVARAEQSTVEFDEFGILRYRSNSRFTNPATPALTVTSTREIAGLKVSEEIDSVRNVIDVPYSTYRAGSSTERFTSPSSYKINPLETVSLSFDYDVTEYDSPPPLAYVDSLPSASRVRFGTQSNGGVGWHGRVEVTTERDGTQLRLTFRNRSSNDIYLVTKDGGPSLSIYSIQLAEGSPVRYSTRYYGPDSTSVATYGPQVYQVPATPWLQRIDAAGAIAYYLLQMSTWPLPTLGDVEVLPDPRIQLGDLVRVVDQAGAALDTTAFVVGIKTTGDASGQVRQVLTLRATTYVRKPSDTGLTPDPPLDPGSAVLLGGQGVTVP